MPKRVVENIEIRADECFDDIKRAAVKLLPRSVQDEFEKKDRGISPYHGKFLRISRYLIPKFLAHSSDIQDWEVQLDYVPDVPGSSPHIHIDYSSLYFQKLGFGVLKLV